MAAADKWFEAAREAYQGDDEGKLLDRAMRVKGDVDRVVFDFLILEELRAIRAALEARNESREAKP